MKTTLTWPSGRQEHVRVLAHDNSPELGHRVQIRFYADGRRLWVPAGWVDAPREGGFPSPLAPSMPPESTNAPDPMGEVGGAP